MADEVGSEQQKSNNEHMPANIELNLYKIFQPELVAADVNQIGIIESIGFNTLFRALRFSI